MTHMELYAAPLSDKKIDTYGAIYGASLPDKI